MVGFDDRLHHAVNVFFKNLIWISISNLLLLSVPDEEYFRNAWCALNYISTFLLLSVGRYLCWRTISPRGYHSPSSQCFGTDIVYQIHFL